MTMQSVTCGHAMARRPKALGQRVGCPYQWFWSDALRLDEGRQATGVAIDLSEIIHVAGCALPAC